MKTIAIRFSDVIAPKNGTIYEHQTIINKNGYVWFGKLGNRKISEKIIKEIFTKRPIKILLIHTQSTKHYLALVDSIVYKCPELNLVPYYYRNNSSDFRNWFKIKQFIEIEEEELQKFYTSSGNTIANIYKKSMGSYFIVDYRE